MRSAAPLRATIETPVIASSTFFGALNTLCRTYDPDVSMTLDAMIDATLDLLLHGWSAS